MSARSERNLGKANKVGRRRVLWLSGLVLAAMACILLFLPAARQVQRSSETFVANRRVTLSAMRQARRRLQRNFDQRTIASMTHHRSAGDYFAEDAAIVGKINNTRDILAVCIEDYTNAASPRRRTAAENWELLLSRATIANSQQRYSESLKVVDWEHWRAVSEDSWTSASAPEELLLICGDSSLGLENIDEAISCYQRYSALRDDDRAVKLKLAACLLLRVARLNSQQEHSRALRSLAAVADICRDAGEGEWELEFATLLVKCLNERGAVFLIMGDLDGALQNCTAAVDACAYMPEDFWASARLRAVSQNNRGSILRELNRGSEAEEAFSAAIVQFNKLAPTAEHWSLLFDVAAALKNRAKTRQDLHRFGGAAADLEEIVRLRVRILQMSPHAPRARELAAAHLEIAWLLATCPDAEVRDGESALAHSREAQQLLSASDFVLLDTLAAASAETGDYPSAVRYQRDAIQNAPADVQTVLLSRLKLYESRQPYRSAEPGLPKVADCER